MSHIYYCKFNTNGIRIFTLHQLPTAQIPSRNHHSVIYIKWSSSTPKAWSQFTTVHSASRHHSHMAAISIASHDLKHNPWQNASCDQRQLSSHQASKSLITDSIQHKKCMRRRFSWSRRLTSVIWQLESWVSRHRLRVEMWNSSSHWQLKLTLA